MKTEASFFNQRLLKWYDKNKRDLPWRHTRDPYKIWLSEIMLQQTRVEQGLPYYNRIVKKYPTVFELSSVKERDFLNDWQGLGYYSRARNLLFTANHIVNNFNGKFPETYEQLTQLKGIGRYTAAAIASFSYKEKVPVVDGNVVRVLSRFFSEKTIFNSTRGFAVFFGLAQQLISKEHPDLFNQAMMELGALVCTPKNPNCINCPIHSKCLAYKKGVVDLFPVKGIKIAKKQRYFNYFIIGNKNEILLHRRGIGDIWNSLYDFPLYESKEESKEHDLHKVTLDLLNKGSLKLKELWSTKQILTHQIIHAKFWEVNIPFDRKFDGKIEILIDVIPIKKNRISEYPMPKLILAFLAKELL